MKPIGKYIEVTKYIYSIYCKHIFSTKLIYSMNSQHTLYILYCNTWTGHIIIYVKDSLAEYVDLLVIMDWYVMDNWLFKYFCDLCEIYTCNKYVSCSACIHFQIC